MSLIDGSSGTHGLHPTPHNQNTQDAPQIGQKSIGSKIASFFSAIGSAIAAPFKALGHAVQSLFSHAGGNTQGVQGTQGTQTAPTLQPTGDTFTTQEKQQMLDELLSSEFYKSFQNSTTSILTPSMIRTSAESLLESPGSVRAMKAHGVTLGEAVAISIYTSQAYKAINDQIRSGNETPEVTQVKDHFTTGLAKLPSFEGTVFRGAHLPKEVGLMYQEGNVVTETGIMSTTYEKDQEFPRINYSITLQPKDGSAGKDISMFSDKPWECEVAFPPGTQLFVMSREMSGQPQYSHMHPPDYGGNPCGKIDLILREV